MSAATVPRVRTMVSCDEALLSEIEAEDFLALQKGDESRSS